MSTTNGTRTVRHPIRGAFAGLAFGIGVAFLLISFAVIALGTLTPFVVVIVGVVLGLVLSLAVPPLGKAPVVEPAPVPVAPPGDAWPTTGEHPPV